jgi:hypothetical protein
VDAELVLDAGAAQRVAVMNSARLNVGLQGVAIADRAYQQALSYARDRRQGGGGERLHGQQHPLHVRMGEDRAHPLGPGGGAALASIGATAPRTRPGGRRRSTAPRC